MKSLIVLALALSTSAFASPAVGDMAAYTATSNGFQFSYKVELSAFNEATGTFTQKGSTTLGEMTTVESEEVTDHDLVSDETVDMVLGLCETEVFNGTLETITVAAGTFETCKVTDEQGTANFGRVPFGLVKYVAETVTMELKEYNTAQ